MGHSKDLARSLSLLPPQKNNNCWLLSAEREKHWKSQQAQVATTRLSPSSTHFLIPPFLLTLAGGPPPLVSELLFPGSVGLGLLGFGFLKQIARPSIKPWCFTLSSSKAGFCQKCLFLSLVLQRREEAAGFSLLHPFPPDLDEETIF